MEDSLLSHEVGRRGGECVENSMRLYPMSGGGYLWFLDTMMMITSSWHSVRE